MNELEIKNKFDEIEKKGYTALWIVLKNSNSRGAYINEITNISEEKVVSLNQANKQENIRYSDIANIMLVY